MISGWVNGVYPKTGCALRKEEYSGVFTTLKMSCTISNADTEAPTTMTFYMEFVSDLRWPNLRNRASPCHGSARGLDTACYATPNLGTSHSIPPDLEHPEHKERYSDQSQRQ